MSIQEVVVPDIGDVEEVQIIELLVAPGDQIAAEDSLVTLESDKASMEIPSPIAGTVKTIAVNVGDTVSEGSLLVTVDSAAVEEAPGTEKNAEPVQQITTEKPAIATAPIAVNVPDIGDFDQVEVIEVLVNAGDAVNVDNSLITLESDKASMEIPSPYAGTVESVLVTVGQNVAQGSEILTLIPSDATAETETVAEVPKPESAAAPEKVTPPPASIKASPTADIEPQNLPTAHASPSVRKFARELGADLLQIKGSGRKGRILKDDVKAFIKQALTRPQAGGTSGSGIPAMPEIDFSKWGEIDSQPLTKINRLTGETLHRAWLNVPHVTQFDEADISDLETFRKRLGEEYRNQEIKITLLMFLLKASACALKTFPRFNSSLDATGENLILKKYCHIGIAVDTAAGLVVPVIRDVDKKSLLELAVELTEVSIKARDKKLTPAEMQGGCFTISSLGGIGGKSFTPIVNAPEVAILGVSRAAMQPVWNGAEFEPKLIMPFSLSYDHRVIDGADGARFTSYLAKVLADTRRLLL